MMWNFQVAGLLCGATVVCYDGSPQFPRPDTLWARADRAAVSVLGISPALIQVGAKAGVHPTRDHDLARLRCLGVTGSVAPPAAYEWVRDEFGGRIPLVSITGGTDVVSAFAGAVPTVPIWSGEISVPCLGVALDAWDPQGRPVCDEVGELVVTSPMPSMPLYFWDDPDGSRYRAAYFDTYPGVWRHGDWITITSRGSVVMHGRSDSTLNRNGIRMGSADIYQAIEQLPEIRDSLVLGVEEPGGGYWMPLFVVLADAAVLTPELTDRIRSAIRASASPRHVPDEVIAVPAVPRTRTGKKLEVPVKRILQGARLLDVIDPEAVDDSQSLAFYLDLAHRRSTSRGS
jgi:acetoacetyl-CoA synthetase